MAVINIHLNKYAFLYYVCQESKYHETNNYVTNRILDTVKFFT